VTSAVIKLTSQYYGVSSAWLATVVNRYNYTTSRSILLNDPLLYCTCQR